MDSTKFLFSHEMKIAKEDFIKFLLHLSEEIVFNDIQIRTEDNLLYGIYTIIFNDNIHISNKYKPQLVLFREHFPENDDSSFLKCLVLSDDEDILIPLHQWFSILPDYFYIIANQGSEDEFNSNHNCAAIMQDIKDINNLMDDMLAEASEQHKDIINYPSEI